MRRFSQRNTLVTLNDINITPLLDLAFVLLIIFIITTPLMEHGLDLELSPGGRPDTPLRSEDIRVIEINAAGDYFLQGNPASLDQIEVDLARTHSTNAALTVYIRADANGRNRSLFAVIDRLQRRGISRYSFRTEPSP